MSEKGQIDKFVEFGESVCMKNGLVIKQRGHFIVQADYSPVAHCEGRGSFS